MLGLLSSKGIKEVLLAYSVNSCERTVIKDCLALLLALDSCPSHMYSRHNAITVRSSSRAKPMGPLDVGFSMSKIVS